MSNRMLIGSKVNNIKNKIKINNKIEVIGFFIRLLPLLPK